MITVIVVIRLVAVSSAKRNFSTNPALCYAQLRFISALFLPLMATPFLLSPTAQSFAVQEGDTALHHACREKQVEVAKWLVEQMTNEAILGLNEVRCLTDLLVTSAIHPFPRQRSHIDSPCT